MSLTYQPFADTPRVDTLRDDLQKNISDPERLASASIGAALLAAAVTRHHPLRALLVLGGLALLGRAWNGRCPWYAHLGIDRRHESSGVPGHSGVKVEHTLEIRRSPEVLYGFWRNLEQLPKIMRHVESVRRLSSRRSHWKVRAPLGQTVEWEAEIINEIPSSLIAWQTLPGASVRNAGSVWFEATESGSTRLKVAFEYDAPGGTIGATLASLLGGDPRQHLIEDLSQFKAFAERELAPFSAGKL